MTKSNTTANISDKVDTYPQTLVSQNRFSGSILIARDGEVLKSSGYGLANREHGVRIRF